MAGDESVPSNPFNLALNTQRESVEALVDALERANVALEQIETLLDVDRFERG